jgi:hypothetical protein
MPKVYLVDYAFEADEKVYVVDYAFEADKKVYPVDYAFEADKKVYRVDYAFEASVSLPASETVKTNLEADLNERFEVMNAHLSSEEGWEVRLRSACS